MGWASRLKVGPGKAGYVRTKPLGSRGVMSLGAIGAMIEGEVAARSPRMRLSRVAARLRAERLRMQKAARRGNR